MGNSIRGWSSALGNRQIRQAPGSLEIKFHTFRQIPEVSLRYTELGEFNQKRGILYYIILGQSESQAVTGPLR